jgi:cephalosporin hydroxylase
VTSRLGQTLREYWLERAAQHTGDSYAGLGMSKFPEDLRVYEHLLWESGATAVIEIGSYLGGSALWFRDRLRALAGYGRIHDPKVISVDLETALAREQLERADPGHAETIALVEGDVRDPEVAREVGRQVPAGATAMVVEDAAHTYDVTRAALEHYADFVPVGGFFVVEDGCVDVEEMRLRDDWPRGVLPALHDWLATPAGERFRPRRDLELYGISCHPEGFLERIE